MNYREELEEVIFNTIYHTTDMLNPEVLTVDIHSSILRWMSDNQIVFYQP